MNHKSKLMAIASYGAPSIARAMEEVDPHRFKGAYQAVHSYKPSNSLSTFSVLGSSANKVEGAREKKLDIIRKGIECGRIKPESMPALLRDYPELMKGNSK